LDQIKILDFLNKKNHRLWVFRKFKIKKFASRSRYLKNQKKKKKKNPTNSGYLKNLKQPLGFIKNYQGTFLEGLGRIGHQSYILICKVMVSLIPPFGLQFAVPCSVCG
jgi:hypothetical protein